MSIVGDAQITSWLSKSTVIDNQDLLSLVTGETSDYVVLCIRPDERALLTICLSMYVDWLDKWLNFASESDRQDLIARTYHSLGFEMACSEDIQSVIDQLTAIATAQTQIRDNISTQTTTLNATLQDIRDNIGSINTTLATLDIGAEVDQLEEILDQVARILGAVGVAVLP